jgi:hypothetical protein
LLILEAPRASKRFAAIPFAQKASFAAGRDAPYATKAFVGDNRPDDRFRPGDRGHRTIATNGER